MESKPIHGKDDDIDDRLIGDSGSASDHLKEAHMMEKLQSTNNCFEFCVVVVFAFV